MKFALAIGLIFLAGSVQAQDDKGTSLGSLLDGLKDIKVPESVTDLPKQLTELKDAYLETTRTVEQLQLEVSALREEVAALRSDNAELRAAVGEKVKMDELTAMQQPVSISADDLAKAYATDRNAAEAKYKDHYLKVIGAIDGFESGVQEVIISLRTNQGSSVKCHVKRDSSFHVEVIPSQGRLINRNDRSTLLTVGQPVAVIGTGGETSLDVHVINCRIDGLEVKRMDNDDKDKK